MRFKLGPLGLYLNSLALALLSASYLLVVTGWYIDRIPLSTSGALVLVILPLVLAVAKQPGKIEPYGSFQRSLNDVPGRETTTEWLNMGYWTSGCSFPDACEALALRLALPVCVKPGHVLDVGFGSGDSLLLQLNSRKIPRPLSLTGITSIGSQFEHAENRIQHSSAVWQIPINLYQGDAVFRNSSSDSMGTHPLDPTFSEKVPRFDSILALDCAYHFSTRKQFLEQCHGRLRPETGRIALADLCFEPGSGALARYSARVWARALSVPSDNLITLSQYRAQLEGIGYDHVQIEDISEHVFPGFISFLSSRGLMWRLFAHMMYLWWRAGGRYVLVTAGAAVQSN